MGLPHHLVGKVKVDRVCEGCPGQVEMRQSGLQEGVRVSTGVYGSATQRGRYVRYDDEQ